MNLFAIIFVDKRNLWQFENRNLKLAKKGTSSCRKSWNESESRCSQDRIGEKII